MLFLMLTFFLNACASRDEVTADESSMQSAAVVPGEQVAGEAITPGTAPGGAGANVRW